MDLRETEAFNEVFHCLGLPVETSPRLLEAHDASGFHARFSDAGNTREHPKEYVDFGRYLESCPFTLSPIKGTEAASSRAR
jgi:hypothetical protein